MAVMDVLSSRLLLHPRNLETSQRFYRDILGLAVYREFAGGLVFFLGNGLLEVSGQGRRTCRRPACSCGCRCATSVPSTPGWPRSGCRCCARPQLEPGG